MLVQKNLANMLKQMVAAENTCNGSRIDGIRAGHDAFYKGDIAKSMVAYSRQVGGILSEDDLANYEAEYGETVKGTFLGHEISSHSTWTQGIMALQILNILENFDLKAMGHNSPQYTHTVLEATKLAFADREAYYGDPNYATVPIDGLISKEYASERAQQIDPERAHPELPAAGDPWKYSSVPMPANGTAQIPAGVAAGESGNSSGTTHIACIDRDGNLVCATPSGGSFSKGVFFPEQGAAISTRIEMFNFIDGHPNRLEPGKRPRTTLINYIVSKDGTPVMTIGCPGGDHQAQANVQLMLNTLMVGHERTGSRRSSALSPPRAFRIPSIRMSIIPTGSPLKRAIRQRTGTLCERWDTANSFRQRHAEWALPSQVETRTLAFSAAGAGPPARMLRFGLVKPLLAQTRSGRLIDKFMRAALDEARQGFEEGGVPIGATLVSGDTIVATGRNRRHSGWRSHHARGNELPVQRGQLDLRI